MSSRRVGQQPFDAVLVARFFVGGQRQDHVAIERPLLAMQAQEVRDPVRVERLHVGRAAAVVVAVALGQAETARRSSRSASLRRRPGGRAAKAAGAARCRGAGDQVLLGGRRAENPDVAIGESRPAGARATASAAGAVAPVLNEVLISISCL